MNLRLDLRRLMHALHLVPNGTACACRKRLETAIQDGKRARSERGKQIAELREVCRKMEALAKEQAVALESSKEEEEAPDEAAGNG